MNIASKVIMNKNKMNIPQYHLVKLQINDKS